MPDQFVQIIQETTRKSTCHNCSRIIVANETKVKINYPHTLGFRYYYLCKECGIKLLVELQRRLI
jgi:RNase P subunit RPR2